MVPFCPLSGATSSISPGTKYVHTLPLDVTRADVVAVISMAICVSVRTLLPRILTRTNVVVVTVKSISASTPPNVTVVMLPPCPKRLVPVMLTKGREGGRRKGDR